jgi:hypothetical protein
MIKLAGSEQEKVRIIAELLIGLSPTDLPLKKARIIAEQCSEVAVRLALTKFYNKDYENKPCKKWSWNGMPGNECSCGFNKEDHKK